MKDREKENGCLPLVLGTLAAMSCLPCACSASLATIEAGHFSNKGKSNFCDGDFSDTTEVVVVGDEVGFSAGYEGIQVWNSNGGLIISCDGLDKVQTD